MVLCRACVNARGLSARPLTKQPEHKTLVAVYDYECKMRLWAYPYRRSFEDFKNGADSPRPTSKFYLLHSRSYIYRCRLLQLTLGRKATLYDILLRIFYFILFRYIGNICQCFHSTVLHLGKGGIRLVPV